MGFFDRFPLFYETSQTSPQPHRLNGRYDAIIAPHQEALAGRRILDIGSHDGRWAFAALHAGAAHITGIEPRPALVGHALRTFAHYGVDEARYRFLQGDVFALLDGTDRFDVVLCLGFFYHTIRHAELLDRIERSGARLVVLDTEVTPAAEERPERPPGDDRLVHGNPYVIQLLCDPVGDERMACADRLARGGHTLVGRPSRAAVALLARHFGFALARHDWGAYLQHHDERSAALADYRDGWRETFTLRR